jgi:hypothetical protein
MRRTLLGASFATITLLTQLNNDMRVNARGSIDNLADRVEFQTFELDGEIEDMMWCG